MPGRNNRDGDTLKNQRDDFFDDENFNSSSYRTRTNSFAVGKNRELFILIVNKNGEENLLEDTNFDAITPLGSGRQGKVYAAKVIFENEAGEMEVRYCVLKNIPKKRHSLQSPFDAHEKISEQDKTSIENNMIKLIKIIQHEDESYALLPYCPVFLNSVIEKLKKPFISNSIEFGQLKILLTLHVLSDLCDAYISMHLDKNYVHGDVKPANIGLYLGHWCLIDMDCAKKAGSPVNQYSGTVAFSHPSAIHDRDNASNPSTDLFALGEVVRMLIEINDGITSPSDREMIDISDNLYRQALHEKYQGGIEVKPFSELIQNAATLEEKIKVIALCLKRPLATDQPDVLALKKVIAALKEELFSQVTPLVAEEALEQFYNELKSDGYFNVDSSDPFSPSKSCSRKTSLCSSSLFSTSTKSEASFDGSTNESPRNEKKW